MSISPYKDKNKSEHRKITEQLVQEYPLTKAEILEISTLAWEKLWNTKVGNSIKLSEVNLPATVVGYFFQKLYTHELENRYSGSWRGEYDKSDKDIEYISNSKYSTEMKSSGQAAYKVFGNRSYCQSSDKPSKAKSGYYITINFFEQQLTLVSIGWIDKSDWKCQKAESGQAATLPLEVYTNKLIHINGAYQLLSPICLLNGVGPGKEKELKSLNITTFKDVIDRQDTDQTVKKIYLSNKAILDILKEYL